MKLRSYSFRKVQNLPPAYDNDINDLKKYFEVISDRNTEKYVHFDRIYCVCYLRLNYWRRRESDIVYYQECQAYKELSHLIEIKSMNVLIQ